jgi:hypothetical protein
MHNDRIRDHASEAQHGNEPDGAGPVSSEHERSPAPASNGARPPLSQVEQERADDEGMVRQDND